MKFKVERNSSLIEVLLERNPGMSKTKAKRMIENNQIRCGERELSRATDLVEAGEVIELEPQAVEKVHKTKGLPVHIIYEDRWIVVVHKPAGIIASGDSTPQNPSLFVLVRSYLRERYGRRCNLYPVHRLDREVEGLIMFARTVEAQTKLKENWKEVNKYYLALTDGVPSEKSGTITSWLREEEGYDVHSYDDEVPESKQAITHYRVLKASASRALLEIKLETGRKHQIRVHLSSMGWPIVGDKRYGDTSKNIQRVHLLSYRLEFIHPFTNKQLTFNLPVPDDFVKLSIKKAEHKRLFRKN